MPTPHRAMGAAAGGRALDCMIVGGHKCGTTSLKEYLGAHPEVATHPQLEFTAFSQKDYSPRREREELGALLDAAGGRLALAKHAGLYAEPFSLDRLHEAAPDCKLLLILRDPVARARSAFRMEAVTGAEREPFETIARRAIEREAAGSPDWRSRIYLEMGCYGRWLGEILDRFPRENVLVQFKEEFEADPAPLYEEQCRWLGIDPSFRPDLGVRHNVGADPRSPRLARAVKRLRSERNPLKRAARRALPQRTYLRIAEAVRLANRVESETAPEGRTAIDAELRRYFEADGKRLTQLLGREPPWPRAGDAAASESSCSKNAS